MISVAVQNSFGYVEVYDEKNHRLYTKDGELHGYTGGSVSVKCNGWIKTYDEKGNQISSRCV